MRIAVTGATGFIGRHVVAHFAARGDDVVPVGRPLERTALARACEGAEAIVHLAGVVSTVRDEEYFAVNVDATRAVAEAASAIDARLVHISSLAAAGPASAASPRTERDRPAPINAYGASKLAGERAVSDVQGLRWIVLRPGVVYGGGDRALLPLFVLAARGVVPVIGRPEAAFTFVHVSDLVRAIAAAATSTLVNDVMFVGHPRAVTTRAVAKGVQRAVARRALVVPVPALVLRLAAWAGDAGGRIRGKPWPINSRRYAELATDGFVCRVDRLHECLGIVAKTDLDEGLAEAAVWYRREGWL
jgi:nucleoside-diphosphate-sugar epimerase